MVDGSGFGRPGRLAHGVVVQLARSGGQQQGAAALSAVSASHPGQQRHRAQGLAALGEPGHALAEADEGCFGLAVEGSEALDICRRQAGDRGDALRRKTRQYLLLEPIEAAAVFGDIGAVAPPVARQDVHDAQGQCRVGADADRQVPIGLARGAALARIDDDELDAALSRGLDLRPEMHIGGDQIGAPGDDQIGMHHRFRVGAADRPDGHVPGGLAAGVAHRAGAQAARAKRMKQAVDKAAVDLALMRAVGVAE